jgi:hypothetical protein
MSIRMWIPSMVPMQFSINLTDTGGGDPVTMVLRMSQCTGSNSLANEVAGRPRGRPLRQAKQALGVLFPRDISVFGCRTNSESSNRQGKQTIHQHVWKRKRKGWPRTEEVDFGVFQGWLAVPCRSYRPLHASRKILHTHGCRCARLPCCCPRVSLC